jgi:hypothetical protein
LQNRPGNLLVLATFAVVHRHGKPVQIERFKQFERTMRPQKPDK